MSFALCCAISDTHFATLMHMSVHERRSACSGCAEHLLRHAERGTPAHVIVAAERAGAYWRGDESQAQLTRVYGTAWASGRQLEAYRHMQEEAAKRDHRKLGAQLQLFTIQVRNGDLFVITCIGMERWCSMLWCRVALMHCRTRGGTSSDA